MAASKNNSADEFDVGKPPAHANAKEAAETPAPDSSAAPPKKTFGPIGLPTPNVPSSAEQKKSDKPVVELDKLPASYKETTVLLKKLSDLPERNAKEEEAKRIRMDRVKAHWAKFQQGLPVLSLSADDIAKHSKKQHGLAADVRRTMKARTDQDYAALLRECEQLKTQLAAFAAAK